MLALLLSVASAAWPDDPSISRMTSFGGVRAVDTARLGADYRQLMAELGTVVANKPILPAATTGASGFEFAFSNTFVFLDAIERTGEPAPGGGVISPWDRVSPDEEAPGWLFVPQFSARKGLPLSTEVGGSIGWIGLSRTGTASVYGRVALIEGSKPLPDLTLQVGYAGYIGNDELELGVLDLGVTIGSRYGVGAVREVNTGRIEPFANFSLQRVTAAPTIDARTAEQIGAVSFRRSGGADPIALPQVAAGFQVTNGNVHFRLAGSWCWKTLPTATAGMGFTF